MPIREAERPHFAPARWQFACRAQHEDACEIMEELGLEARVEEWEAPARWRDVHSDEIVAFIRRRLCLGPERDNGDPTYVLVDDWVPPARTPSREVALGELARRYFAAYGPATVEDLGAWSGISMAEARSAVTTAKASLAEVTIQGQPGFVRKDRQTRVTTSAAPRVRLLPAFDPRALAAVGRPAGLVEIAIVDDAEIRRLNARYRGIGRRTDVLAFPL